MSRKAQQAALRKEHQPQQALAELLRAQEAELTRQVKHSATARRQPETLVTTVRGHPDTLLRKVGSRAQTRATHDLDLPTWTGRATTPGAPRSATPAALSARCGTPTPRPGRPRKPAASAARLAPPAAWGGPCPVQFVSAWGKTDCGGRRRCLDL